MRWFEIEHNVNVIGVGFNRFDYRVLFFGNFLNDFFDSIADIGCQNGFAIFRAKNQMEIK